MFTLAQKYLEQVKIDKSPNTLRGYTGSLELFFKVLNVTSPEDVVKLTDADIADFLFGLKERLASSSVNAHGRNLLAFFRWLNNNGYPNTFRVKTLKQPKTIKAVFSDTEVESMLANTNHKERVIILMLAYTGLRRDEISSVKLSDIQGDVLLVSHGKGSKQRKIPLHPHVLAAINEYIKKERDAKDFEYLFYSRKSLDHNGEIHKLTGEAIRRTVKMAMIKAGIAPERAEQLSAHSLRRYHAVYLLKHNVSINKIALLLGHSSTVTTAIYLRSAGAEIAAEEIAGLPIPDFA
jgi:site-specific recombinase XerD